MNTPADAKPQQFSEEFLIRVNDMIEYANRIERRLDTAHAQMVMLHAFSRYSAHHYRSTASKDDVEGRQAFAAYVARGVEELIFGNIAQLAGPPQESAAADKDASAE
jgi:hypothetical protein